MTLLQQLSEWQKAQMKKEGLPEAYMVLPFKALKEIASGIPRSEDELLAVKGVGPVKVRKYGRDILAICSGQAPAIGGQESSDNETPSLFDEADAVNAKLEADFEEKVPGTLFVDEGTGEIASQEKGEEPLGVGDFLEQLNQVLGSYFPNVRVRGEVIGFKRNQNGHAYFEIKDEYGIMRASVFRQAYDMSGVDLSDGDEIIITGKPSHHAQYGFSFIGERVELAGEGALKKAYDALKKKLTEEGLLDPTAKREVPELPTRVGLITSPTGAAIGDFTTNVGKFGYTVRFHPSSVEGSKAVQELLVALKKMAAQDLDVLVITRGGGSLESLQAFNNENVVRAIRDFPVPVIAGIGHEQDETLSTLAADIGVSTPTAAARAVRESWDEAITELSSQENLLLGYGEGFIRHIQDIVRDAESEALGFVDRVVGHAKDIFTAFDAGVEKIGAEIVRVHDALGYYEKSLTQNNPERQLALGYSMTINAHGKIIRKVHDVKKGEQITTKLSDGEIRSELV